MKNLNLFFSGMGIVSLIFLIGIFPFFGTVDAQSVPEWIKNTAKWWAEGKISDQEYIDSIQFLVDQEIITIENIPIKFPVNRQKLAPTSEGQTPGSQQKPFAQQIVPDSDRAQWQVIRLSGGELTDTITLYTIGKVESGEDPTFLKSLRQKGFTSYFLLESLPNKENVKFYQIVSRYINPGKTPELFNVSIISYSGDGTPILTANYNKCRVHEYYPFVQDFVFAYQLNKKTEEEIRDRAIFYCGGFNVDPTPNPSGIDSSKLGDIPSNDDRALTLVVHFFNGELRQVYSTTFPKFAPSVVTIDTPLDIMTIPGNEIGSAPQFFLESLPSIDRQGYYEFISRYVNPGKTPELLDVSADLVTGDGTILQRWNYVKCYVTSYSMELNDSILRYPFADESSAEIRDKTDFSCSGANMEVYGTHKIEKLPIKDFRFTEVNTEFDELYTKSLPSEDERAMSYTINALGGELTKTYTSENFPIFKALAQNRGSLTPAHSAKQYDIGFYLESLPSKDRDEFYSFIARYVNPGKAPEPFNAHIDVITGDGRVLETLQYTKCSAIDFDWYTQQLTFLYQISNKMEEEIRERYTFYCDGFRIDVP